MCALRLRSLMSQVLSMTSVKVFFGTKTWGRGGGGGYRLPCSPQLRCLIFRSFSLKVSAGVRDGKKYREYSLKIIKVKKMRVTPGDEIVWDQAPMFGKRRSHSVMGILIPKTLVIWALTVTLTQITKVI